MITNLFVKFPEGNNKYQQWEFAPTQLPLMAHIALGMLLLIASIALLIRAMKLRDKVWLISARIGLGAILLAIMSGSEFISTQKDGFSLVMALLFIIALTSFGWGVYKAK